jgi:hypothetical protein
MKVWIRARLDNRHCGRCGIAIAAGAPMLVYVAWQLVRCRACADEPPPADVGALPDTMPAINRAWRPLRASLRRASTLDARQRQLGADQ